MNFGGAPTNVEDPRLLYSGKFVCANEVPRLYRGNRADENTLNYQPTER